MKYERLPDWCAVCGHLGHQHKEHGVGVHPPKALVFKDLRATWFRGAGRGPGEGRARRGGFGRGAPRGGANSGSGWGTAQQQKYPAGFEDPDALMEDVDPNRKRPQDANVSMGGKMIIPKEQKRTGNQLMLMAPPVVPPSPSKQDPKRAKVAGNEKGLIKRNPIDKPNESPLAETQSGLRRAQ